MHVPTRSSVLYGFRIFQTFLATAFLVLICWCGVHRAWWDNINGPLAIGVITAILTLMLTIFSFIVHRRSSHPLSGSTIKTLLRVGIEVVLLILYGATAGLMLRQRTGCLRGDPNTQAAQFCFPTPTGPNQTLEPIAVYDDQPLTQWNVAIALSFVEIFSFIVTTFLVFVEDGPTKLGASASYA